MALGRDPKKITAELEVQITTYQQTMLQVIKFNIVQFYSFPTESGRRNEHYSDKYGMFQ